VRTWRGDPCQGITHLAARWMLIKRTGSNGSQVGPALTRTAFPLGSAREHADGPLQYVSTSASRPASSSRHASESDPGFLDFVTQFHQRFQVALRGRISHIFTFHGRTNAHGGGGCEQNCREQIVRRFRRPFLPLRLAVAGARMSRSGSLALVNVLIRDSDRG